MQTYLVHMRRPLRLVRELGMWKFLGFQALFGGFLLSVLAYPWLFVVLAIELYQPKPFATVPGSLHHVALSVALVELIAGILAALLIAFIGNWRARRFQLAGDVLTAPIYWLLISIAGYRALWHFIWLPHLWEKTAHSGRQQGRMGSTIRRGER